MSLFRYQVFYQQGTDRPWTNVWHVDASDLAAAAAAVSPVLVPDLLPLLGTFCNLVRVITSTPGTPGAFIEEAFGDPGTSGIGGDPMPLFATIRVLLNVGVGRQDYKFFRGLLAEGGQNAGILSGAVVSVVEGLVGTLLSDMTTAGVPLVDTDLQPYVSNSCQLLVQDRQRHRRRRRTP